MSLEHCHGLNGVCLSYVLEVSVQLMPVEAPQAAWDAAGRAQQAEEIDFEAHLCPWEPETFFLGDKLKYGCVGGGSVRQMAMAWYRGLKMGSGYPREMECTTIPSSPRCSALRGGLHRNPEFPQMLRGRRG